MSDPRFQLVNVLPDDVAMGEQGGGMSDAAYMARDPRCTCPPSATYSAEHVDGCPLRILPLQLATCDGCGLRQRVPRATDSIGCPTAGCRFVLRRHEQDDKTAPVMASEAERLLLDVVILLSTPVHRPAPYNAVNESRRYLLTRGLLKDGE